MKNHENIGRQTYTLLCNKGAKFGGIIRDISFVQTEGFD